MMETKGALQKRSMRIAGHRTSLALEQEFWAAQGWQREPVLTRWVFDTLADLEAVVRIELPGPAAEQALAEHAAAGGGTEVDYAVDVWWRRF